MLDKQQESIIRYSDEILEYLLNFKKNHPDFTFCLRQRNSSQKTEVKRLESGMWFQGSDYILVPLFRAGDDAQKIKTFGFVLNFDKSGEITSSTITISFKAGIDNENEKEFHRALAAKLGIKLSNHNIGDKFFENPKDIFNNLNYYLNDVRDVALSLLKKYNLNHKYEFTEAQFDKMLAKVNQIKTENLNPSISNNIKTLKISPTNGPLNQIFYGPPGTGKTYNTINKAIEITNSEFVLSQDRKIVKAEFDRLIKEGQIVFTTFHQSMSYEDFIEGIKPLKPEEDDEFVKYDIQEGIFKQVCRQAIKEFYKKGTNDETFERLNSFENAWNDLLENIQKSIDNGEVFPLDTISGQAMDAFGISDRGNLYLRPQYEGAKDYTVSHDRTQKLFEAFPNLEVVNNIDKEFRSVIGGSNSTAYWSVLNYIINWLDENPTAPSVEQINEINDALVKFDNKIVKENIKSKVLNYVIIIDEINRGNVSQIFGELITLIEEDKRLGKNEALEVTLPYSKEKFGVPPNLYIIGTMNTADRSVEALDTALRRRFTFKELMPNAKVVEEEGFSDYLRKEIMEKINNRIELLLDRNHTLGHAYFIKDNFKHSFENEIIPLLQEYFYSDYGKIGLVLGKGFVQEKSISTGKDKSIFADFETKNDVEIFKCYELIPFNKVDFDAAIAQLLA